MAATYKPSTGRRKEAVARVQLIPGEGKMTVNGRPLEEYFPRQTLIAKALAPLTATNTSDKYDVVAHVRGGGVGGQAGALRMGIARELVRLDSSAKGPLGKEGLLTRDARMKERKKYGQPGARKRFQFSKR
jgi:small subunit ribosomal protein S9